MSTVIWKPLFSIQPGDCVVDEGKDAIFECEATGSPRPETTWLRNNSLLFNPNLIQNGSISYLVLRSVKKEQNSGMYQCMAVNIAGRTLSKAGMLTVTSKQAEIPTANASHDSKNHFRCSLATLYILISLNCLAYSPNIVLVQTISGHVLSQSGRINTVVLMRINSLWLTSALMNNQK